MPLKKTTLLFVICCLGLLRGYTQTDAKHTETPVVPSHNNHPHTSSDSTSKHPTTQQHHYPLEIPSLLSNDTVIIHTGYSLVYNEVYEQAKWVAYELTKEETFKAAERTNKFIVDPKISTHTADNKDYKGSGYDKGHLAPAGDMSWSPTTMYESFYFSNMSPQVPAFNRGIWKQLEELVRTWAVEDQNLYIVTGPIIGKCPKTIGTNEVAVPDYYFKVILDYTNPDIKGIGFILPNEGSKEPLQHFALSIDAVEKITGIDFFPSLPDEQENSIEKTLCITCWHWKQD
jgi:endonuclease G